VTAEIISVGTELLLGQITDTHAVTMAKLLAECGIGCQRRQTIGDNLERLTGGLRESLARADIVVTIGGLGPTQDDLTRDAIAAALDDELVYVSEVEEHLRKLFALRNLKWTGAQVRQAYRPASARLIDNPNGTAPGLICEKDGKVVIALPGPRGEFNPMAAGPVKSYLSGLGGGVIHSRVLRVCRLGESAVEERTRTLMEAENPTVAPYAHLGEVHLRLTARAASVSEADRLIDPVDAAVRSALGSAVFGVDDTTLEAAVLEMLIDRGQTVCTAESITGGGLGERFTSVPGCSGAFLGGFITYDSRVKSECLGVSSATLENYGPVSAETAREMAVLAREKIGADYAVSLTGNAGPTSDEDDKPVGLVFIGVAGPDGVEVQEFTFRGTREDVRRRSQQAALVMLRTTLLGG
jgi:nicotinamide-nucleotide amidase